MCGVYGFTGHENLDLLQEMGGALSHRGPDSNHFYQYKNINLGLTRLSIVDISLGVQPWERIEGKVSVVCNGEIYNYRALRQVLEKLGYKMKSDHSDTEVIPYLYLEYGIEFIEKLDGMFAIALFDHEKNILYLIRDRVGKKPLYYTVINNEMVFASEIKALLKVIKEPKIDQMALSQYFSYKNTMAPQTIYEDIYCVEPGHYIKYTKNRLSKKCYWDVSFTDKYNNEEFIAPKLIKLIEQAVYKRIDMDVDYGVFLSGGLDSSLISAIAQKNTSSQLKSFTLSYEDDIDGKNSDTVFAKEFAKKIGTKHYNMVLNADEVFQNIEKVLHSFDEPFSGTISTFFLSKFIAQHVKVALSGDGSDELFGSYLTHRLSSMLDSKSVEKYKGTNDYDLYMKMQIDKNKRWRESFFVFSGQEQQQLLNNYQESSKTLLFNQEVSHLNQTLDYEFHNQLPNQILAFADRLSMAHSLEIRSPFLDKELVQFVSQLGSSVKIDGMEVKSILKKCALKYLPRDLAYRKKEGFVLPVYKWIETKYYSYLKSFVLDSNIYADINREYVQLVFKNFEKNKKNHAQIWSLYNYAVWKTGRYNEIK